MRHAFILAALAGLLLLAGCAGVGIVATSDPLWKLEDAHDLFTRQGRPIPAERLIREAIASYRERDDAHGLGLAYREYAQLLHSASVVRREKAYRRDGFQDESITFDNRLEKASEFCRQALTYFDRAEREQREAGKYDALTNVYLNMAASHIILSESEKACAYFDRALEAYHENLRRNPAAKPVVPGGAGSMIDFVSSMKGSVGCK